MRQDFRDAVCEAIGFANANGNAALSQKLWALLRVDTDTTEHNGAGDDHQDYQDHATPPTAHDTPTGEDLREEGAEAALSHALREDELWIFAAESAMDAWATSGLEFTAEDLRAGLPAPRIPNAVGSLFLKAASRKQIEKVSYRKALRPDAHSRVLAVWRGVKP